MQTKFTVISLFLLVGLASCSPPSQIMPSEITPATAQNVLQAVRDSQAKVVLVNMWASWCGPCREEFPALVKVQKEFASQGLKVIYVSWDEKPADATNFLAKQGVEGSSFIKSDKQADQAFLEGLEPKWTGGIPATFIYDEKGTLIQFWEDQASYDKFKQAVQAALNKK